MIKSMTGFGRDSINENGRSFVVEVKSVNHRYLDLNIKMPRSFLALEEKIREIISKKVNRGKVDVYINMKVFERDDIEAVLNKSLLDSYLKCLYTIRDEFNVRDDISVVNTARLPEVIGLEQREDDLDAIWESIRKPLENALDEFISMREREGTKLKEDIDEKCNVIEEYLALVETKTSAVVEDYRARLNERIKQLVDENNYDESRVAMEIAIFADKCCIDEEVVRLKSHITQVRETIGMNEAIGRKLDFIVQEMNREANTMASKSNDLFITRNVLEIKSAIEKIREQTQNVE